MENANDLKREFFNNQHLKVDLVLLLSNLLVAGKRKKQESLEFYIRTIYQNNKLFFDSLYSKRFPSVELLKNRINKDLADVAVEAELMDSLLKEAESISNDENAYRAKIIDNLLEKREDVLFKLIDIQLCKLFFENISRSKHL